MKDVLIDNVFYNVELFFRK